MVHTGVAPQRGSLVLAPNRGMDLEETIMTTRTYRLTALAATLLLAIMIGLVLLITPSASADEPPDDAPQEQVTERSRHMYEIRGRMHDDPQREHHRGQMPDEAKERAYRDGMRAPENHRHGGPRHDEAEHDQLREQMRQQMREQLRDDCEFREDRPHERANQQGTVMP